MLHCVAPFVAPWIRISYKRAWQCSTVAPCRGGAATPQSHVIGSAFGAGASTSVQPSPTQSNQIQPNPTTSPHPSFTGGKETVKFLAVFDHLLPALMLLFLVNVS